MISKTQQEESDKELLRIVMKDNYDIRPCILGLAAWSYTTTAYYVETAAGEKYIAKISNYSREKMKQLRRDIYFSEFFAKVLPTPKYLINDKNKYLIRHANKVLRVAKYIEGTAPFDMNLRIFSQIIKCLNVIHSTPLQAINTEIPALPTTRPCILHGDLTESNTLVANQRIVGILDFEYICTGPVEYDLAKTTVYCWLRMKKYSFEQTLANALKHYDSAAQKNLIQEYAVQHIQRHIAQIKKYKKNYTDQKFWQQDLEFFENVLRIIKT